jgi:hypothetical protein
VRASGPLDDTGTTTTTQSGDIAKQWYAAVENQSGGPVRFKVFAICSAKSNATIEATTFQVGAHQTNEAYAKCPGKERALGGGVVQSGQASLLTVRASGPLDETNVTANTQSGDVAKQWYAAVYNGEAQPRDLKVFAICSAKSKATIVATPFQVRAGAEGSGQTGEESAVCPGNKRALGGGMVEVGPPTGVYVQASGPLDDTGTTTATQSGDIAKQWYAAVHNSGAQQRDLKVFAICQ